MYSAKTLALAIAPLFLVVNAKVDFDLGDAPNSCKTICRPISQLSDRCNVDLRSDIDLDENRLEAQCFCTNKSFDVGKIAALCADCMHQSANGTKRDDNRADQDDLRDIDNLLSTCGFSSTKYSPDATGQVQSITVSASKPTDISQLTTTLDGSGSQATGSNSNTAVVTRTDSTGGVTTVRPTNTAGGQSGSQTSSVTTSTTSNAAAPMRRDVAADALFVAGAVLAAGMMA